MERKLLRVIINPAMIAVWVLGLTLSFLPATDAWHEAWFHAKFALVIVMSGMHGFRELGQEIRARRQHALSAARFYRIWNEVPAAPDDGHRHSVVVKPF